jgi:glycolate oxidase iron-sulfur subunit
MLAPAQSAIRPDELSTCISCGLCLNDCPTFRILGDEADSPRGRIALMRTLVAAPATPDPSLVGHLEACLVCRACETACPSGVPFGRLMEAAREVVHARAPKRGLARLARMVGLAIVADPARLALVTRLLGLYQRTGLRRLARRLGLVPRSLRAAEALAPERIDAPFVLRDAPAIGAERHHVAFFAGCVMRTAFGETDRATVRVLRRNGCRVSVPAEQVCCGALHAHAGEGEGARRLARRNIAAFERSSAAVVLVNAAGCGAHLKAYDVVLRDDPDWRARAAAFSARVRDVTEFLAPNLVAEPRARPGLRVAYQDACHLSHGQRVRAQPRALIRAIPGVTLVELADGERCCGSAGVYNLTHSAIADELGGQKAEAIERARPDVVVSANPGCLLQISAHLERRKSPVKTAHIMTLLDEGI